MPFPPEPVPPSQWRLSATGTPQGEDLVAVGGDLAPGTLLEAYASGLFPMPVGSGREPLGWWSPDPRAVFPAGALTVHRSLAKVLRRFEVRVDTAFADVVAACADPARDGGWITADIAAAYTELHRLGWAHSVETWQDGELVGGLYGVGVGGLFAGESMFHRVSDASKVALVALDRLVHGVGDRRRIIDTQWATDHLARLGVQTWPRELYLARLRLALQAPPLDFAAADPGTLLS